MNFELIYSSQFKKDFKKIANNPKKVKPLVTALNILTETGSLPIATYKTHELKGNFKGCMEAHILSDFLIIWFIVEKNQINIVRIGSHSDLF
ncbi:MAG: type II toxin-antitoxin system YafQ family toxin, partial [Bacteroidales bacterium]